jgi:hypothetical protein
MICQVRQVQENALGDDSLAILSMIRMPNVDILL